MNEHEENISRLLLKSMRGELSPAEDENLHEWAKEAAGNGELLQRMMNESLRTLDLQQMASIDVRSAEDKIAAKLFPLSQAAEVSSANSMSVQDRSNKSVHRLRFLK